MSTFKVRFVNPDQTGLQRFGWVTGMSGKNYVRSTFRNGRHESDLISLEEYQKIIMDVSRRWHLPLCKWIPEFVEVPDAPTEAVPTLEDSLKALTDAGVEAVLDEAFFTIPDREPIALGRSIKIVHREVIKLPDQTAPDVIGKTEPAPDFTAGSSPAPDFTVPSTKTGPFENDPAFQASGGNQLGTSDTVTADFEKMPFFELRKRAYAKQKAGNLPVRVEKMKTPALIEFLKAA